MFKIAQSCEFLFKLVGRNARKSFVSFEIELSSRIFEIRCSIFQKVLSISVILGKNYKKFAHQGTIVKQDEKLDDVYWVKLDKNAGVVKRNRVHLRLVHKPLKCVRFLSNKK